MYNIYIHEIVGREGEGEKYIWWTHDFDRNILYTYR